MCSFFTVGLSIFPFSFSQDMIRKIFLPPLLGFPNSSVQNQDVHNLESLCKTTIFLCQLSFWVHCTLAGILAKPVYCLSYSEFSIPISWLQIQSIYLRLQGHRSVA